MTATLATPAVGPAVTRLDVGAYTIATDAPESDGTLAWDATTIVVVEAHAVIDADPRVWGMPNVFVCDGSVMPTQGSANPAITIMALASRLAGRLAAKRVDPASTAVAA